MALSITRVEYRNFRNMEHRTLEPHSGLTVLVGPNAVGKTNCVEGITLLTSGRSFRHLAGVGDFVREGARSCRVEMLLEGEKRRVDVAFEVESGKKRLLVNGKSRRLTEGGRLMPSVLFYPDDLMVIKGPASGRRDMLDEIGMQLNETYGRIYRDYRRALSQRNALLRDEATRRAGGCAPGVAGGRAAGAGAGLSGVSEGAAAAMLEAWTEALVGAGSMLYLYRRALLERLTPLIARAYSSIAPGERLTIGYESSYAPDERAVGRLTEPASAPSPAGVPDGPAGVGGPASGSGSGGSAGASGTDELPAALASAAYVPAPATISPVSRAARPAVERALRARLAELRVAELARGTTLAGPHHDDVTFAIDGRPARLFGSQGQQRTISLAEKIAHVNLVRAMTGSYPVFLLDDVMSELDATRRSALFGLIHTGVQTIMTTTNLDYFTPAELERISVVEMRHE